MGGFLEGGLVCAWLAVECEGGYRGGPGCGGGERLFLAGLFFRGEGGCAHDAYGEAEELMNCRLERGRGGTGRLTSPGDDEKHEELIGGDGAKLTVEDGAQHGGALLPERRRGTEGLKQGSEVIRCAEGVMMRRAEVPELVHVLGESFGVHPGDLSYGHAEDSMRIRG